MYVALYNSVQVSGTVHFIACGTPPYGVQPKTFFGSLYSLRDPLLRGCTQKSEPLHGCTTSTPNSLTLTPWDLVNKIEPKCMLHFIKCPPTYRLRAHCQRIAYTRSLDSTRSQATHGHRPHIHTKHTFRTT